MLRFIAQLSGWRHHPLGFSVRFFLFEFDLFSFGFRFCFDFSIVGFGSGQFVCVFDRRLRCKPPDFGFALRLFALRLSDMLREGCSLVVTQAHLLHFVQFVRVQKIRNFGFRLQFCVFMERRSAHLF